MALQPVYTGSINNTELTTSEQTGIYNNPDNLGGYGAPNADYSDCVIGDAKLYLPDSEYQLSSTYWDATAILQAAGFPSSNILYQQTIPVSAFGETAFAPGWYRLVVTIHDTPNNIDYVSSTLYFYNSETVEDEIAEYGLTLNFLSTGSCKKINLTDWTTVKGYLFGVETLWESEQYEQAMELLLALNDKIDAINNGTC